MSRCIICQRQLIKDHQETHNDNYNLCNKCYKKRFGIERRYIYQKESKQKYYRCALCNQTFPTNGAKIGNECSACKSKKNHRVNRSKMKEVWKWVYDKLEDNNRSALYNLKEDITDMLLNFTE